MRNVGRVMALLLVSAIPSFAQATDAQSTNPQTPSAQTGSTPTTNAPTTSPQTTNARPTKKDNAKGQNVDRRVPKIQVEFGPTFDRYTGPDGYYRNMPGWTGSGVYNVFRWLGGEFQASGAYNNKAVVGFTSLYTAQVGPVFYPLRHHRLTPWGHFLYGEGYYRDSIPENGGFPAKVNADFAKAWRVGAGVDLALKNRRWGVRMLQFDYTPTKFFNTKAGQPDYRISIGLTYRIDRLPLFHR